MNAAEYFAQMCKEAGLDDAATSALTALANNEKLSPKFNSLVKRATEDFDAQTGRVKAAEEKVRKYDEWYPTAKAAADAALQRTAEVEAELARRGAGGDPPAFDASKYLTKEDLLKFNEESSKRFAGVLKDATRIAARHVSKFGEEPDLDAIEQVAVKENLPLAAAYDRWIQPRVDEANKKQFQKEKEEYANQKVADTLSRYKHPVDQVPTDAAPVYAPRPKAGDKPVDIDAELMAAWNGAANGNKY